MELLKLGEVWSYRRQKFLSPTMNKDGYPRVDLSLNGVRKTVSIHRLVAETYIPNPDNLPIVNHKDENKQNPHKDNLEWVSVLENNTYGERINNISKKNSRAVYCVELKKLFSSQTAAAEYLNIDTRRINDVVRGKQKSTKGYHFCYKEEMDKLSL